MSLALCSGWACPSTMHAMVLSWQRTAISWSQNILHPCRCGSLVLYSLHIHSALLNVHVFRDPSACSMLTVAVGSLAKAGVGMLSCRTQMSL